MAVTGALISAVVLNLPPAAGGQIQRYAYVPAETGQPVPTPSTTQPKDTPANAAATAPLPLMSLISLNKQRMYVYDANGLVAQTRVSTGQSGYDTPKGIYSVIQKDIDHASNIYEGASMPHMQRLLWSGIALHGGEVPSYPASHGCVRLPWDFAEKYFGMTKLNHRVIITPEVQAPVRIENAKLFSSFARIDTRLAAKTGADPDQNATDAAPITTANPSDIARSKALEDLLVERAEEKDRLLTTDDAAKSALEQARAAEVKAAAYVASLKTLINDKRTEASRLGDLAEKARRKAASARQTITAAAKRVEASAPKTRADKLSQLRADVVAQQASLVLIDGNADLAAREAASAKNAANGFARLLPIAKTSAAKATEARVKAEQSATLAAAALEAFQLLERQRPKPISVFISSRTKRISLRQGFEPVAEADVTIDNPRRPLGSYVFTALNWHDDSHTSLDWVVTAVDERGDSYGRWGRRSDERNLPKPTDARRAQEALERIQIPAGIQIRIAEVVKPGSTLIISDYDMARSETSKGTDFIVQMPEVVAQARTAQDTKKVRKSRGSQFASLTYSDYTYETIPGPPNSSKNQRDRGQKYYFGDNSFPPVRARHRSSIPSFFGYAD